MDDVIFGEFLGLDDFMGVVILDAVTFDEERLKWN